jgi:dolichyl-phosphate-mannose-protein mannosyltransferase
MSQENEGAVLRWSRTDTLALTALLALAAIAHFWRLGSPNAVVYDEKIYVDEALHLLRGEVFFETHPLLGMLLIAASIRLFGCHSICWRLASAIAGTALVAITYLLGRRLFNSRAAGAIAATLVLTDGMFFEYSRLGLINIFYVTFGAGAFLMLFRFIQSRNRAVQRHALIWMGVLLGLSLGSKLAIPAITCLLTIGFLAFAIIRQIRRGDARAVGAHSSMRRVFASVTLVSAIAAILYLAVFIPQFWLGWWTGIGDLFAYYQRVLAYNSALNLKPFPLDFASPWWSWPLLLRPYRLWKRSIGGGGIEVIWGGGNPAIWWCAGIAMVLAAIRAVRGGGMAWWFLAIGYIAYAAMWIPVRRVLFIYSYMPALYLAILAAGGLLAEAWNARTRIWEELALLVAVMAVFGFGLGGNRGLAAAAVTAAGYGIVRLATPWSGKYTCTVIAAVSLATFAYFLPVYMGLPITREAYLARMWFRGNGLANWM